MKNSRGRLLVDLFAHTSRLTRVAATASGDATPSAQWRVLSVLAADGPQRVGALAAALRISQPAITQFVPQLEEQGLVARAADPEDARATVLTITSRGREALDDWKAELGGALTALLPQLTADDWATLERAAEILGAAE